MEQNKDQSGAAVRGEAVSGFDSAFSDAVKGGTGAYIQNADGTTRHIDPNDMMSAEKVSACAADAPSEPSELCGIPTLRDLAELFHASAMSNTAVLIHPESARSLFDAMTTPPKDESAPLSYVCRVEPHQDRIILDDKYESIDTVRAALAKSRAADALDSQPTDSNRLTKAEREADLACETCHGTGQMCVGTSGQESDGNRPVMEPCAECGYGDDEPTERQSLIACLDDDAAMLLNTNPDDEMALTMRQAAAMIQRDGERHASSQPTDGGVRNGQLMRFYAVDTMQALIDAQEQHIAKLQATLPRDNQAALTRVREG